MTARAEASFSVEGRRFRLAVWKGESSAGIDCSDEAKDSPIAAAVATAWLSDPSALLRAVEGRTGLSYEGDVAFGYGGDDEPQLPPGVTAHVFGRNETVSEKFFARFVAEFGLACLDASGRVGLDDGKALKPKFLALRERAK